MTSIESHTNAAGIAYFESHTNAAGIAYFESHTNAAGIAYFSTINEDGETIYSFGRDFSDFWTQDDQDAIDSRFFRILDSIRSRRD